MLNLVIIALLSAALPEVEVQTVEGEQFAGTLVEWKAERLVLKTEDGQRSLSADELSALAPRHPSTADLAVGKVEVQLVDGSSFSASQYTARAGTAAVVLPGGRKLSVPRESVSAVRLQGSGAAAGAQWERILKNRPTADILVVQRGEALDYHKGVIREVSESEVLFELDGEALPVKRTKVAGLVYYCPPGNKLAGTLCRIVDMTGARWIVREVQFDGEVRWTTLSGVLCNRPVEELKRVEFASDKVLYLSDLKAESVEWVPWFQPDKEQDFLSQFFAPRQDRTPEGKPLHLGGKAYRKGLAMNSRTTAVFRLPDRYRRFKATAGIDDEMRPRGSLQLVIRGDDRVLLETEITGTEEPRNIDLDVTGVRRLTVTAEFGKEMDQGDHLLLCEARVIK